MIPLITTATHIFLAGRARGRSRPQFADLLRDRFDRGHESLRRDDGRAGSQDETEPVLSDGMLRGTTNTAAGGAPIDWREYAWSSEQTLGGARWGEIRWRFHRTGHIAFNGAMATGESGSGARSTQGHRIELRTGDGRLVGAWLAAFRVRSGESCGGAYTATRRDPHPLLAQHFDELAEDQSGRGFRGR